MKISVYLMVALLALCSFSPSEWFVLQKKEAGFKMSFPKEPTENDENLDVEGESLKMHTLMCEVASDGGDERMVYAAIYSDHAEIFSSLTKALTDTFFNSVITSAASGSDGKVMTVKNTPYKSYPGRSVKISFMDGQGLMIMKMYIVKNRVYVIEVGCLAKKEHDPSVEKFFNSFQLLDTKDNKKE